MLSNVGSRDFLGKSPSFQFPELSHQLSTNVLTVIHIAQISWNTAPILVQYVELCAGVVRVRNEPNRIFWTEYVL